MRIFLLTPIIIALFLILLCSSAGAWELPKVGVEAHVQEAQQYTWVKERSHSKEPVYIYNDPASIADREFQTAFNKLGEHYDRK